MRMEVRTTLVLDDGGPELEESMTLDLTSLAGLLSRKEATRYLPAITADICRAIGFGLDIGAGAVRQEHPQITRQPPTLALVKAMAKDDAEEG